MFLISIMVWFCWILAYFNFLSLSPSSSLSLTEPEEAPTGITTTVMNSTVRVKWNEAQNVRGLLLGYKVPVITTTQLKERQLCSLWAHVTHIPLLYIYLVLYIKIYHIKHMIHKIELYLGGNAKTQHHSADTTQEASVKEATVIILFKKWITPLPPSVFFLLYITSWTYNRFQSLLLLFPGRTNTSFVELHINHILSASLSDLHQEVGFPRGSGPEVSWKATPGEREGGEIRAREGERQREQGGGGQRREDLGGSAEAEAVLSVRAVCHRLQQQRGGPSLPTAPLQYPRGRWV